MIEENSMFKVIDDAFPHIGKAILAFWGHHDFHEYMDTLQHQKRDGKPRAGFPLNIMLAIFNLTSEHEKMFPELAPPRSIFG
jgi:hypothetical protein